MDGMFLAYSTAQHNTTSHHSPLRPCGRLERNDNCTEEEKKSCCKTLGECKRCTRVGGAAKCVDYQCMTAQKVCRAGPGCTFKRDTTAAATTSGLCTDDVCGEEECEPVDPCKEKKCAGGEVCKVFGEKAYCKRENAACAGCKGVCVVDANGAGKCTATDVCASVRCQLGTACVDVKGSAKCLSEDTAPCKGACKDDEECVPEYGTTRGAMEWKCVRTRDPDADVCTVDECACRGDMCEGGEKCLFLAATNTTQCMLPEELKQRLEEKEKEKKWRKDEVKVDDPCGGVLCAKGEVCRVSGTPQCEAKVATQCDGVRCGAGQHCSETTGACVETTCETACADTEKCVRTKGENVCVEKSLCGAGWTWKKDTCMDDTDCPTGTFCPARTSTDLEVFVSEHCACDGATGDVDYCSPTRDENLRKCQPAIWPCDLPITEPKEKQWCCDKRQIGCDVYQCATRNGDSDALWATAKKDECCKATRGLVGCGTEEEFSCYTDEEWGFKKHKHCCEKEGVDCPAPEFDCEDGKADTWGDAQQVYCNSELNCDPEDTTFNCSKPGMWGREKRDFCCCAFGERCTDDKPDFKCDGDAVSWGAEQREFCCLLTNEKGCNDASATEGPYRCAEGTFTGEQDDETRRRWCCKNADAGCTTMKKCVSLLQDSKKLADVPEDVRDKCCSEEGKLCKFLCPNSPELVAEMTDSAAKKYCCSMQGKGCDPADIKRERDTDEEREARVPRRDVTVTISGSDLFERALENPMEFGRDIVRVLVMFLIERLNNASIPVKLTLKEFGSLDEKNEFPVDGEDRVFPTDSWLESPWGGHHVGDVETMRTQDIINTPASAGRAGIVLGSDNADGMGFVVRVLGNDGTSEDAVNTATGHLENMGDNQDNLDGSGIAYTGGDSRAGPLQTGTTTEGGSSDDDGDDSWIYILIGCLAGACLLGVAVGGVVYSRSKNASTDSILRFSDMDGIGDTESAAEMGTSHTQYQGQKAVSL